MPDKFLETAIAQLQEAVKCLEKVGKKERKDLANAINNISKGLTNTYAALDNAVKLLPSEERKEVGGKIRKEEKIRRCAYVIKMVNIGLNNKQIGERLAMTHTNVGMIRKEAEKFKDDPYFLELLSSDKIELKQNKLIKR